MNQKNINRRVVFFLSDQTGVTAETLGRSLLTQFEEYEFDQVTVPFIDTVDKADETLRRISAAVSETGSRPIIFSTLVHDHVRERFAGVNGLFLDFFGTYLGPMERELLVRSSHTSGRAHGMKDTGSYDRRMDATNFALNNDDGARTNDYERADVILLGVSRSGKTPTCLYMGLHYGVRAANYPLLPEDLESGELPPKLRPHRARIHGLTIDPKRLAQIREQRRAGSRYASIEQCRWEVEEAERLFKRESIPMMHSTHMSIEEIASKIMQSLGLHRQLY